MGIYCFDCIPIGFVLLVFLRHAAVFILKSNFRIMVWNTIPKSNEFTLFQYVFFVHFLKILKFDLEFSNSTKLENTNSMSRLLQNYKSNSFWPSSRPIIHLHCLRQISFQQSSMINGPSVPMSSQTRQNNITH